MEFNVDTDEVIKFTNDLEKLNRSAFPNAVRGTLNGLAFDVKTKTMPEETKKDFINRQKNFFKANSGVDVAKGFNLRTMVSVVGFKSKRPNNQAVENLEQQEKGGEIKGRSFLALHQARTSKSINKLVAKRNRISGIKNIVNTSSIEGKTEGQKFIKSIHLAGSGGFVLSHFNRKGILWRVDSLDRKKDGKFKLTAIQSYEKGRSVRIKKATHFMENSSVKSSKKSEEIYIKEANRQFNKYTR